MYTREKREKKRGEQVRRSSTFLGKQLLISVYKGGRKSKENLKKRQKGGEKSESKGISSSSIKKQRGVGERGKSGTSTTQLSFRVKKKERKKEKS